METSPNCKISIYAKPVLGKVGKVASSSGSLDQTCVKHWAIVLKWLNSDGEVINIGIYESDSIYGKHVAKWEPEVTEKVLKKSGLKEVKVAGEVPLEPEAAIQFCKNFIDKKRVYHVKNDNCQSFCKEFIMEFLPETDIPWEDYPCDLHQAVQNFKTSS